MSDIGKCPECNSIIAFRFPIHICKSVRIFDGDNQKLIDRITIEERDKRIEILRQTNADVNIDIHGDIVFHKEI